MGSQEQNTESPKIPLLLSPTCSRRLTTPRPNGTSPNTPLPILVSLAMEKTTTPEHIACKELALPPTSRLPPAVQNSLVQSRSPPASSTRNCHFSCDVIGL